MNIIERKAAKAAGLVHYFTGTPCKRGHIDKRFTGSGNCLSCSAERMAASGEYFREYYLNNRAKKLAAAKAQAARDPAALLARVTAWAKKNPGRVASAQRRYKQRHPGVQEARVADWGKRNPEKKLNYGHTRRVRQVSAIVADSPTPAEVKALREVQGDLCAYCSSPLGGKGHLDHMTPISRSGLHIIQNLQWTCPSCNRKKGAKTDEEFRRYLLECDNATKRSARRPNGARTPTKDFEQRNPDVGGSVI